MKIIGLQLYSLRPQRKDVKVFGGEKSSLNNKKKRLSKLKSEIDEMREVLNEVCCSVDNEESKTNILTISQDLDELIVEYMKQINEAINDRSK